VRGHERSEFELASFHQWLGLRQASRYASVSDRTLRSWIHSPVDPLPAVRVGGKILIKRSELDAWLGAHAITPLAKVDLDAIVRSVLKGQES
jgi:excisionase family DNA binding protein